MVSRETPKPFTIAIVGGGIGGVSLAISLAAQNVPFHIYESAPSFGEIGAGVAFGPNVVRAIHGISPAMLRAYARHVTANEPPETAAAFLTYRKGDGPAAGPAKLFDLVGPVQEVGGAGTFPARCSAHRAHLLDELVRLLPEGTASFGKALVSIDEESGRGRGEVRLVFADGSSATASAVVGCDGIKSVTRQYLHGPEAKARYSGFYGYRAMAPRAQYERVLGPELASIGNAFTCWNGYAISYPVDHGSFVNMFATCAPPGSVWEDQEWKIPSSTDEMLRDLEGWHPGLLELLRKHGDGQKWAMFHYPHDQAYAQDRVCLLGDSAHATTPHLGAGAGMAVEDAFILGRLLGSIQDTACIPHVFKCYDAVRKPRTQEVVRNSKDQVATYIATSSAEEETLEHLKRESHLRFLKVWDFDLDGSLAEALSILETGIEENRGQTIRPQGI